MGQAAASGRSRGDSETWPVDYAELLFGHERSLQELGGRNVRGLDPGRERASKQFRGSCLASNFVWSRHPDMTGSELGGPVG